MMFEKQNESIAFEYFQYFVGILCFKIGAWNVFIAQVNIEFVSFITEIRQIQA